VSNIHSKKGKEIKKEPPQKKKADPKPKTKRIAKKNIG
jgi:hypothetical protein